MRVEYRESRPVVTWLEDASKGVPDFLQNMREHFGVKALEWKYEEEVRYVMHLEKCVPRTRMYFTNKFPLNVLQEVIIGPRSSVTPAYLRHFLAAHYEGIRVSLYTAHMHPERYEIESRPFPPN